MEKLKSFVMSCLHDCANYTERKEIWLYQAFGVVQFYILEHPEQYKEVDNMWSELKPRFEYEIWGTNFEL